VGCDCVVDFCFEDGEEAEFAEFLVVLGSEDEGAVDSTCGTERGCHFVVVDKECECECQVGEIVVAYILERNVLFRAVTDFGTIFANGEILGLEFKCNVYKSSFWDYVSMYHIPTPYPSCCPAKKR